MSDSPKMSIPKFKYKLQTCKIKSSKLSSLIDSFRPFINQTCSMKLGLLVKSNNLRIFTNFKTLGHEFSIYGHKSRCTLVAALSVALCPSVSREEARMPNGRNAEY